MPIEPGNDASLGSNHTGENTQLKNEQVRSSNPSSTNENTNNNNRLTPIKDLKDIQPHNEEELTATLKKAIQGKTFLPENFSGLKSPFPELKTHNLSTSRRILFPQAFSSPKHLNASFNNLPSSPIQASRLRGSPGNNATKGAYDLFDKPQVGIGRLQFGRKRKRIATPSLSLDATTAENRTENGQQISKVGNRILDSSMLSEGGDSSSGGKPEKKPTNINDNTFYGFLHSVLSNPQCITNLTLVLQVLLNAFVLCCFIIIVVLCFMSVKRDVDRKVQTYIADLSHKIAHCRRQYLRNNCAPEMRVPALESSCNEWENCMSQDPESVVTSVAYFEILADCLNAFFHDLNFRTICSLAALLFFAVILPNFLFSKFRQSSTTTNTTTTTNNNTYYNITKDQNTTAAFDENSAMPSMRLLNDKNESPDITRNSTTVYLTPGEGSPLKSSNNRNPNNSVRFNPNVSYSFYNDDYQENNNTLYFDANQSTRLRRSRY